jgi:hypothetical protein
MVVLDAGDVSWLASVIAVSLGGTFVILYFFRSRLRK